MEDRYAEIEIQVDTPGHAWAISASRRLWLEFIGAGYTLGMNPEQAIDTALRRFISSAQGNEPPPLSYEEYPGGLIAAPAPEGRPLLDRSPQ